MRFIADRSDDGCWRLGVQLECAASIGMRGKPRPRDPVAKQPSGEVVELDRERIARTAKSSYNVASQDLPPGRREVTPVEI